MGAIEKEAALDAANIENGGELAGAGGAAGSTEYFITVRGTIASVLAAFSEPVTASELAAALNVKDAREITRRVQLERLHGAPICASCDADRPGYFLARNPGELAAYLKSLCGRIGATTETYKALEATLDVWRGQGRIVGWEGS